MKSQKDSILNKMGASLSLPNLGHSTFTFSTGEWAKQANGSVCVSYGDTFVMVAACMSSQPKEGEDFLPLTVEYQEKTYAMGKIPGGFLKREGRPKDGEILSARLIDRPLRPLFPQGFTNETQVVAMVLSSDAQNDPDVLAVNAASCALFISDIPFYNPVGAVRVSQVDNKFVINPTYEERFQSNMDLIVVGTEDKIVMLEGELKEVPEAQVLEAIKFAHPFIKEIIQLQKAMREKAGKKKRELPPMDADTTLIESIRKIVWPKMEEIYGLVGKEARENAIKKILKDASDELIKATPELCPDKIANKFFALEEEFMRKKIIEEEKRPDGRALKEIRPIDCKVRVLPRPHGSAVFTRGQTQSLAITTLGTSSDEQRIEALEGEKSKYFMLHYNFPPFSVGEVKGMRGTSRRDIGHGALGEKAIVNMIPSKEDFPYTIRVVSEILESNGSSSMATVCASTLSLMDAGVPIKSPVAGIALGLVTSEDKYKILTDIAGIEDHYGDMDFKVAGTKTGITAIQLDIKIEGLDYRMIEDALARALEARLFILEKMIQSLALPRETVSQYAPKIKSFKIDADKIGLVIGPGGKMIRRLSADYNVMINIDDDMGNVSVVAEKEEDLEAAVTTIINLTKDIEPGEIYNAEVIKITNFGAFCELLPGKQGLLHVSEIAEGYVKDAHDFLKEGDFVKVKVLGIDNMGKISLSIKQLK